MFAVVRTGGKQYRVTPGDKIVVEKLAGEAGDSVEIKDILLAGDGADLKSVAGLTVAAKIIAQAKGEKVTVFKKKRRHNYRRKAGHRQKHTILEIVSIGGKTAAKKAAKPEEKSEDKKAAPAPKKSAAKPAAKADTKKAPAKKADAKPAAKKSTKDAAPAKKAATKKPAATKAPAKKPAAKKTEKK